MAIMELVFATHNPGKLMEVQRLLPENIKLLSLVDIGCHEEIPETGNTLEDNALVKATYVASRFGYDCFADDTGLLVDALNGAPGVLSARYAGPDRDSNANMAKLLKAMLGAENRKAHFKTVIALIKGGKSTLFTGIAEGTITTQKHGEQGFGYDPIFLPMGEHRTFAEMSVTEKNQISHRAKAFEKLINHLRRLSSNQA